MEKCKNCPLIDKTDGCPAILNPHPRFCQLIDPTHHDYNPDYIPIIRGEAPKYLRREHPEDITIESYLTSWQGYGQIAEWLGRGLESRGRKVGFTSIYSDIRYFEHSEFVKKRLKTNPNNSMILAVPHNKNSGKPHFTMWESSLISKEAVDNLNQSKVVIVPCKHNKDVMHNSGVNSPVEVVNLGVSYEDGYYDKGDLPKKFRVGMAARMQHGGIRKGINEGMQAFVDAFPSEDVELEIKVFEDCIPLMKIPNDPRIKINTTPMTPLMMSEWYKDISVLLVPSKGEGFGLHTIQAMACGRPVIACNWSGTADFFTSDCGWSLEYDLRPCQEFYRAPGAEWAVPRHDSMVHALRESYNDQDVCRFKGEMAAERSKYFTWDRTAEKLESVLVQYGAILTYSSGSTSFTSKNMVVIEPEIGRAVETCPFRKMPACGCKGMDCTLNPQTRRVMLQDCITCVTEGKNKGE